MEGDQANGIDDDNEKMDAEMVSDSESGDEDNEQELLKKKDELTKQLQEDKTDYGAYIGLLDVYRALGDLDGLKQTYEYFSREYPLSSDIWLRWIEDEKKMAHSPEEKQRVKELYERALKDYQSVDIWLDYVASSFSLASENHSEIVRSILERAINKCGCDVINGWKLWGSYRDIENDVLQSLKSNSQSEENSERIRNLKLKLINLFQRELALPSLNVERTYEEFKAWLESENAAEYVDLEQLERNYQKVCLTLSQILPFEGQLDSVDREASLKIYQKYLAFEKDADKDGSEQNRIISLYERAIIDHPINSDLWSDYLEYVMKLNIVPEDKMDVCYRALRNCPGEVRFWRQYFIFLERRGASKNEIAEVFEKARQQKIQSAKEYRSLCFYYVYYLRRQLSSISRETEDWQVAVDEIREILNESFDIVTLYFGPRKGDPECEIFLWWARFEAEVVKNLPQFREIWSSKILETDLNKRASYWARYITMEWQYGDAKHVRRYCSKALEKVIDNPEPITKLWLEYESMNCSLDSFLRCQNSCLEKLNKYKEELKLKEKLDTKKAKPEKLIKKKDEKSVGKSNDSVKGKWSYLTEEKQSKFTGTSVSHDSSKDDRTVFVSNISYDVPEDKVRDALSTIGHIEEFRLVRNYRGVSKGFGYLVFSSNEEAEAALKHDRIRIDQRPMFISKCDPDKKTREKGLRFKTELEKNKLFIRNLSPKVDEKILEKIFSPFGNLKDVRLAMYRNGHSKGIAYVEFETEESAAHAILKTDGLEVEGKTIAVCLSNPPGRKNNPSLLIDNDEQAKDSLGGGSIRKSAFGSRGRGRTQLSFVPTQVAKSSSSGLEEKMDTFEPNSDVFKKPMSNAEFKNFLFKKKS